ncbi:MAG: hypothetical protein V9H69_21720 [Anaerolineae bacterium]
MTTLQSSLRNYSPAMLRAIAEANGVELASNQASQMIEQLAALLRDADHVRASLAACTPAAQQALAGLLREEGRSPRPAFERSHGVIRPAGPARLERERPHLTPANPTEELWYRGLLHPTMVETANGLMEFLGVPPELASLLPSPPPAERVFPPAPLPAAPGAVSLFGVLGNDQPERCSEQRFFIQPPVDLALHELCTLLCLAQAGLIALRDPTDLLSWQSTSLYEYQRYSLQPPADPAWLTADGPGSPAALALTLAVELGWLRVSGRRLALTPAPTQAWLGASRSEQRGQLLAAWSGSTRWNDLCRTPALSCEQTGSWSNDAAGTRQRLLPLLARLQPDAWYDLDALAAALQRHAPDFQRPDGNYDTWYIRQRGASAFLRGFEHWEQVEGALLRFVLSGPLHWLGVIALATHDNSQTAADVASQAAAISLSAAGQAWLSHAPGAPAPEAAALTVQPDFTVLVPGDAALLDRFRVARFTTWQGATQAEGQPVFSYRISQTGLHRAAQQGIDTARVLAFLQTRAAPLPANVAAALERRRKEDGNYPAGGPNAG